MSEAISRYIAAKTAVLSPSSIRGYRQMESRYYGEIADKDIRSLTTEDMQLFISSITPDVSAKTVANAYGLLSSSVSMFRPDAVFRVSLPKRVKAKKHAPTDADIQTLFREADGEIKLCIALAAFGSMRRGEICALKHEDVDGNQISVHADMVENEQNKFEYKEIPKTSDSVRIVSVPSQVLDLIDDGAEGDYYLHKMPNAVTHAFTRLRKRLGIDIRFHDLRHYYASIGAVLGIPDVYISDFGGWRRGSGVMKEVYQGVMQPESEKYSDVMRSHFEKIMED